MNKKIRVGIIFGGKSAEHEVSILSAKNVLDALDKDKFEPVLIGIDKTGTWRLTDASTLAIQHSGDAVTLLPGSTDHSIMSKGEQIGTLDVVFPVLHGPMGEDGTIQGFLELANLPYVGPGVLGSAIGMDKDVMKRLLRDAGIPIAEFITLRTQDRESFDPEAAIQKLGLPLFVKPANMGSSVGVSKAEDKAQLIQAVDLALAYDRKILIEAAVVGDEVECSVLGNEHPKVSVPGRIIPKATFYSYEAKYIDDNATTLEIPAALPAPLVKKVQDVALRTYSVLECEGMARVDMFVTKDGAVVVNEINTIPGFTKVSMYPKLWEATGLSYTDLLTELLSLAVERFESRQQLQTSHTVQ